MLCHVLGMQIYLDDEKYKDEIAALERVRAKLGERSGRSTVVRLIREADATAAIIDRAQAPATRTERAAARMRKGAKS